MNDPEALVTSADLDKASATDIVAPGDAAPTGAPAPADNTVAPAATQTEAPEGEQAPAEPPAPPDWFVKEKTKLQRQRRDADRRAERLAAELEVLKRGQAQPQRQSNELRPQDFPNYDAYVEAKIEAKTDEKIGAYQASLGARQAQSAVQDLQGTFLERMQEQAEEAGIEADEVLETLARPSLPFTADVMALVTQSAHTARLAAYLAENPSDLRTLSDLGPALAKKFAARIEASFGAKPKPSVTNAPPPVPKVGGRTVTQKDWRQSDDMEAYAAGWRKDREARNE